MGRVGPKREAAGDLDRGGHSRVSPCPLPRSPVRPLVITPSPLTSMASKSLKRAFTYSSRELAVAAAVRGTEGFGRDVGHLLDNEEPVAIHVEEIEDLHRPAMELFTVDASVAVAIRLGKGALCLLTDSGGRLGRGQPRDEGNAGQQQPSGRRPSLPCLGASPNPKMDQAARC